MDSIRASSEHLIDVRNKEVINIGLPCAGCRGLCCGPVPITEQELKMIRRAVKAMSPRRRSALEHQVRHYGTCIFFDLELDRCGIYSARPEICRAFGRYRNLTCFRAPEAAEQSDWRSTAPRKLTLSVDLTWKDFRS